MPEWLIFQQRSCAHTRELRSRQCIQFFFHGRKWNLEIHYIDKNSDTLRIRNKYWRFKIRILHSTFSDSAVVTLESSRICWSILTYRHSWRNRYVNNNNNPKKLGGDVSSPISFTNLQTRNPLFSFNARTCSNEHAVWWKSKMECIRLSGIMLDIEPPVCCANRYLLDESLAAAQRRKIPSFKETWLRNSHFGMSIRIRQATRYLGSEYHFNADKYNTK